MWLVWATGEMHIGLWWGNLKESVCLDELGVDYRMILYYISNSSTGNVWTGLIWLRIGTGDGIVKKCALLGYYSASSANFLLTFRDNLSVSSSGGFLTPEDRTDMLSRNVSNKFPLLATQYGERAQLLSTSQWKPEITQVASCCELGNVLSGSVNFGEFSSGRGTVPFQEGSCSMKLVI
jgi:hypothetical protein